MTAMLCVLLAWLAASFFAILYVSAMAGEAAVERAKEASPDRVPVWLRAVALLMLPGWLLIALATGESPVPALRAVAGKWTIIE